MIPNRSPSGRPRSARPRSWLQLRALALLAVARASSPPYLTPEGSLLYFEASEKILEMVRLAEVEAENWRRNRTILARTPYSKGCFQVPGSVCQRLAFHDVMVGPAKALVGDKELFVISTNPVRKVPGDRQDLHVDLDLWAEECGGRNSVSVWVLLEREPGPSEPKQASQGLPSPVIFVDGSHKSNELVQNLRKEIGCRTSAGWYTVNMTHMDPRKRFMSEDDPRCRASAIIRLARKRWPHIKFHVRPGPVKPNSGVAWVGWTWHETHDDGHRFSFLAQYGTEECVRAVRRPRYFDIKTNWRSNDWFNFLPVRPSHSIRSPSPFDRLLGIPVGRDDDKTVVAPREKCLPIVDESVAAMAHAAKPRLVRRNMPVMTVKPPVFTVDNSRFDPSGWTKLAWQKVVLASPHLSRLSAHIVHVRSRRPTQRAPYVHDLDEIRIVLDGNVTYGVGFSGECGAYSVYDAQKGHVNFFPSLFARSMASTSSTELVIYFLPRRSETRLNYTVAKGKGFGEGARIFLTGASMAGDSLRVTHSNNTSLFSDGTRPEPGRNASFLLWSLSKVSSSSDRLTRESKEQRFHAMQELGYSHIRSKVHSYGYGTRHPKSSHFYDLILVPLNGAITLAVHGVRSSRTVGMWNFAVVPAFTKFSVYHRSGPLWRSIDVLFVEVAAANRTTENNWTEHGRKRRRYEHYTGIFPPRDEHAEEGSFHHDITRLWDVSEQEVSSQLFVGAEQGL